MARNLSSRHWLLFLLGGLFTLYILFQARFLVFGPSITITEPIDGATLANPVVTISGTARNAAWLSLNDSQIFTDEKGAWSEKLILSEGTSIMTVRVRDRLGREKEKRLTITLKY